MGAGASLKKEQKEASSHIYDEDGLSKEYTRLRKEGNDDSEIYHSLRSTYGSIRMKKFTVLNMTVQNLALQQLSQTLIENRNEFDQAAAAAGESKSKEKEKEKETSSRRVRFGAEHEAKHEESHSVVATAKKNRPMLRISIAEAAEVEDINFNETPSTTSSKTPTNGARISSTGAIYLGGFMIHHKGLKNENEETLVHHNFHISGRSDFVEIRMLGSGASGRVIEAIHIPTLTIVALKMLTVNDDDGLNHISSELAVLYENLAELKLLDDTLEDENDEVEHDRPRAAHQAALNAAAEAIYSEGSNKSQSQPAYYSSAGVASRCPQVLALYDAFIDPGTGMVNLVVEYMDGGSLQDVVDQGGCDDEDVLADITLQVLLGLKFLHDNKQLHRDIKPGNILMNCDGMVKLADFGISKVLEKNQEYLTSNTGNFVGTMLYMAPERISNAKYSYPSDIWSVGMTLLTIARGSYPLNVASSGTRYWDLLQRICDEESPVPGSRFSNDFNDFIELCLKKNPEDRPTVSQLLAHPFLTNLLGKSDSIRKPRSASYGLDFDSAPKISPASASYSSNHSNGTALSRMASRTVVESTSSLGKDRGSSAKSIDSSPRSESKSEKEWDHKEREGGSCKQQALLVMLERDDDISAEDNVVVQETAVRLEHLDTILHKIMSKYESVDKLRAKGIHDVAFNSFRSVNETSVSMRSISRRNRQSAVSNRSIMLEPMVRIPNFHDASGLKHWKHLANQLHCPIEVVLTSAKNVLNTRYLSC